MTTVSRAEVQALIDEGRAVVVDALPRDHYERRHLPGAVNLVEDDVPARAAGLVPDRSTTIVTYCSDRTCGNSAAVARELRALGYADVRTYADGIADWVGSGLAVETSA